MNKLIILLLFISTNSYGQRTYYGYRSSTTQSNNQGNENRFSCEDAIKLIETQGRYLGTSFGGYNSDVIEKIRSYEFKGILYCIVYFVSNPNKGYLYGGWEYSYEKYSEAKKAFENAESKGRFFWDNIEKAKIDCD